MYNRILTLLDGSERAEKVLPHVQALAKQHGSTVLLLQVVEPCIVHTSPFDAHPEATAETDRRYVEGVTEYLSSWQRKLQAEGIQTEQLVVRGPVVRSILDVVDGKDIDLVALASHGRTGLSRVFYGSVAAGILHGVNLPLLVIRAE